MQRAWDTGTVVSHNAPGNLMDPRLSVLDNHRGNVHITTSQDTYPCPSPFGRLAVPLGGILAVKADIGPPRTLLPIAWTADSGPAAYPRYNTPALSSHKKSIVWSVSQRVCRNYTTTCVCAASPRASGDTLHCSERRRKLDQHAAELQA
jgi:hypothetical protein